MKITIDTEKSILYLEESVTYSELQKLCKKLGVDDSWTIEPIIKKDFTPKPLFSNPIVGTNPYTVRTFDGSITYYTDGNSNT